MITVKLISHTPDPEKVVAVAAKMCYSDKGVDKISDDLTPERIKSFIEMLSSLGHESPIEHVSFTFGIEGVSRSLLAQITRHRIASYSVKSQRYVTENEFTYIVPPEIEKNARAKEFFVSSMENAKKEYNALRDILYKEHYKKYLEETKDEKKAASLAEKKAIEDARFVLPNACETKMVVTMNARSLLNFFRLRTCERAQWEIRELAEQMLFLVKEVAPSLFKYAGPSCLAGPCPEGKMSCGLKREKMAKFLGE